MCAHLHGVFRCLAGSVTVACVRLFLACDIGASGAHAHTQTHADMYRGAARSLVGAAIQLELSP